MMMMHAMTSPRPRRRVNVVQTIIFIFAVAAILFTIPYYAVVPGELPPVMEDVVSRKQVLGQDLSKKRVPDRRSLLSSNATATAARGELYHNSYTESTRQFLEETLSLMQNALGEKNLSSAFAMETRSTHNFKFNNSAELFVVRHGTANNSSSGARPLRVMVVCGMHARELFSSDLCRSWLLYSAMASAHAQEAAPIEWLYVPVANPKGRDLVSAAFSGQDGSVPWTMCHRGNDRGVDLNRNWRTYDEDLYESTDNKRVRKTYAPHRFENRVPNQEENPGMEAMSEAETVVLRNLIDEFRPDLLLSVHTGTVSISYPSDETIEEPPTYLGLMRMAGRLVEWSECRTFKPKCVAGQGSRTLYVSRGTMTDYAYRMRWSALPFTLEIFGGPTPHDERTWDNDPNVCFDFFNPPQSSIVPQLKRWRALWKGIYYMSTQDQVLTRKLVDQFANELADDERFKQNVRLPVFKRPY